MSMIWVYAAWLQTAVSSKWATYDSGGEWPFINCHICYASDKLRHRSRNAGSSGRYEHTKQMMVTCRSGEPSDGPIR